MGGLYRQFEELDARITNWMARYGVRCLRISLGLVFLWFGILKFFPDLSAAQELAAKTIAALTGHAINPPAARYALATWECAIGLGLILRVWMRTVLLLLFVQMLGTITPVFLFPHEVFTRIPYAPTLEGQYIIKNVVLISAALVVGATVRGGRMVADPKMAKRLESKT